MCPSEDMRIILPDLYTQYILLILISVNTIFPGLEIFQVNCWVLDIFQVSLVLGFGTVM
jgi:hypothetical protein